MYRKERRKNHEEINCDYGQYFFIGILCTGCQSDTRPQKEEKFTIVEGVRTQVKEEGLYYIDGYTTQMKFYDFELAKSIPICDKPNCKHDSSDCNAFLENGFLSGMGCYREKLYFFDVTDPEFAFYQCDKNGTNRKVLAKINEDAKYDGLMLQMPMVFVQDEVMFPLQYSEMLAEPVTREDGTIVDMQYYWMIGKINLQTGKFEMVKEPEAFDNASEWIFVSDYIDGKILWSKKTECHIFDVKTKEDEIILNSDKESVEVIGVGRENGKIFQKENEETESIYALDVNTKKEKLILTKEQQKGKECFWRVSGDNLVYSIYDIADAKTPLDGELGIYNMNDKTEREMTKEEYIYLPQQMTKDWYVTNTEDGKVCIPKEAYEKKDWSKVQVIGGY